MYDQNIQINSFFFFFYLISNYTHTPVLRILIIEIIEERLGSHILICDLKNQFVLGKSYLY